MDAATIGTMNGAESLVRTLLDSGVDTCFANPGTSEMHFVAALDRITGPDVFHRRRSASVCPNDKKEHIPPGSNDYYLAFILV